jgi:MFS family permease
MCPLPGREPRKALILDRILNGLTRPFWGWISDHLGRYHTMALAFGLEALAILILLQLVHHPLWLIILTGVTFFAWGEIFSLFPAAIGDVFGPAYATTNYGLQYTAKGTASIAAGWGAAKILEATGSWIPVFWIAIACDLLAASLAFCWLRGLVARRIAPRMSGKASRHGAQNLLLLDPPGAGTSRLARRPAISPQLSRDIVMMRKPSEIGELATSFNDMARQLTASIEHMRETTAAKEPIERELKVAHDIQMSMGSGL